MDHTHDPSRQSWVESANLPGNDFPIQNLPFGVYRRHEDGAARVGVAIGDYVIDVATGERAGLFAGEAADAASRCRTGSLNALMALGASPRLALRRRLSDVLAVDASAEDRRRASDALVAQRNAKMLVPAAIGDYTDFYASIHHATNVGRLFRPGQPPLLPNYRWVPIGYHGRASSIVVSGTPVRRPTGQLPPRASDRPEVAPSRRLDYELEVGCFVGPGNALGERIDIERAEASMFGLCLVNDWSARDVQQWEYQPLGPFLGKSFATTISPWVVTVEALEPFRVPAAPRSDGDPQPLAYLDSQRNRASGGISITLEVGLRTAAMRERGEEPVWLSRGDFAGMYWTFAQMLTHHASNGCTLRPGDLLASGTVSGPDAASVGSLLELTHAGADRVVLPGGETRAFLEDGDEVVMRGSCGRPGFARIGLGECRGIIAPAL